MTCANIYTFAFGFYLIYTLDPSNWTFLCEHYAQPLYRLLCWMIFFKYRTHTNVHIYIHTNYTYNTNYIGKRKKEQKLINENKLFRMWCLHLNRLPSLQYLEKRRDGWTEKGCQIGIAIQSKQIQVSIANCQKYLSILHFFLNIKIVTFNFQISFQFYCQNKNVPLPQKITKMNPLRRARILNILYMYM